MGIGSGQARLLKIVMDDATAGELNSVCEYGAQVPLVAELGLLLNSHDNANCGKIATAAELYRVLGFETYVTFDISGEYGALAFDINSDIAESYGYIDSFDVVTNFGTSEHCFNQFQVFRNLHNSCRSGGFMLHTVPAQGWGGHCFFRYDRNFFLDLGEVNSYEILHLAPFIRLRSYRSYSAEKLANIDRMCRFIEVKLDAGDFEGDDPYYENDAIRAALREVGLGQSLFNVTLGCVFRKTREDMFMTPIQSMYRPH